MKQRLASNTLALIVFDNHSMTVPKYLIWVVAAALTNHHGNYKKNFKTQR